MLSDRYNEQDEVSETSFGAGNFMTHSVIDSSSIKNRAEQDETSEDEFPFGVYPITSSGLQNSVESTELMKGMEIANPSETIQFNLKEQKEIIPDFCVQNSLIIHMPTGSVLEDESLDVLQLSTRSYNALRRVNVSMLSDLISMSFDQLCRTKNLGRGSVEDIVTKIRSHLIHKTETKCMLTINENDAVSEDIEKPTPSTAINEIPIDDMPLSYRARNCLKKMVFQISDSLWRQVLSKSVNFLIWE